MEFPRQPSETDETDGKVEVDLQIDVAGVVVLASRDAAEDPDVARPRCSQVEMTARR